MFLGCTSSVAIVTVSGVTKLMWFVYEAKLAEESSCMRVQHPHLHTARHRGRRYPLGVVWLKKEEEKKLLLSVEDWQCDTCRVWISEQRWMVWSSTVTPLFERLLFQK